MTRDSNEPVSKRLKKPRRTGSSDDEGAFGGTFGGRQTEESEKERKARQAKEEEQEQQRRAN